MYYERQKWYMRVISTIWEWYDQIWLVVASIVISYTGIYALAAIRFVPTAAGSNNSGTRIVQYIMHLPGIILNAVGAFILIMVLYISFLKLVSLINSYVEENYDVHIILKIIGFLAETAIIIVFVGFPINKVYPLTLTAATIVMVIMIVLYVIEVKIYKDFRD